MLQLPCTYLNKMSALTLKYWPSDILLCKPCLRASHWVHCTISSGSEWPIWVKLWMRSNSQTDWIYFRGQLFLHLQIFARCRRKQSPQEEPRQPRRSQGSFSAPQIQRTLRIPSFHDPLKKSWKTHKTSRVRWSSWELNWRNRVHIVGMLCRHILLTRVGWEPV